MDHPAGGSGTAPSRPWKLLGCPRRVSHCASLSAAECRAIIAGCSSMRFNLALSKLTQFAYLYDSVRQPQAHVVWLGDGSNERWSIVNDRLIQNKGVHLHWQAYIQGAIHSHDVRLLLLGEQSNRVRYPPGIAAYTVSRAWRTQYELQLHVLFVQMPLTRTCPNAVLTVRRCDSMLSLNLQAANVQ